MATSQTNSSVPHIVALGGGFGSMFLYKKLAGMARRKQIRLTIVDKNNYNCFHGMVPEMIAGKISADSLLNPLRSVFRHAQFRNGTVERIDVDNKKVVYSRGLDGKEFTIAFDQLFLNVGSVENFSLFPGIREHTLRLKQYADILPDMARNIVTLGFLDQGAQNRIGFRVGHAILGRHVQLFAVLGIEL